MLVLRLQGGEAEGRILEGNGESRLRVSAGLAADTHVLDDEMARRLAVEGLQLKYQILVGQLLLERRVLAAGLGHQQPHGPKEKAKLHVHASAKK
ncbi:hypothetical protein D9M73_287170 [compost metagenome]